MVVVYQLELPQCARFFRRAVGVLLVLTMLCWSRSAVAGCGDYVVLARAHAVRSVKDTGAVRAPHATLRHAAHTHRYLPPCVGGACQQRSDLPEVPPVPFFMETHPTFEAQQVASAECGAPQSSARLCQVTRGLTGRIRCDEILDPPR